MISPLTRGRGRLLMGLAAAGFFALMITEELLLATEPLSPAELALDVLELLLLVGCTAASAVLVLQMRASQEEYRVLQEDVRRIREETGERRSALDEHMRQLGTMVQGQFEAWRLSPAEQEVALLLLKGFSHKEIARLRHTGETTIRQQATAVYQKSELSGRAALSAFFLDGLHLPEEAIEIRPAHVERVPVAPLRVRAPTG